MLTRWSPNFFHTLPPCVPSRALGPHPTGGDCSYNTTFLKQWLTIFWKIWFLSIDTHSKSLILRYSWSYCKSWIGFMATSRSHIPSLNSTLKHKEINRGLFMQSRQRTKFQHEKEWKLCRNCCLTDSDCKMPCVVREIPSSEI